ncbi:hypothetical protein BH10PSE14_BH10PSE14_03910 [soil metagenome]
MTGDFTRDTFRPDRGYSSVRMQQGRLFTDADWNEQGDIQRGALRSTARSVIGASGFPEDAPGFAILAGAGGLALMIGGGQAYVDGIGVSYAAPVRLALTRQSGAGAATRWRVDSGTRVTVGDYVVLAGNAPSNAVRVASLLADVNGLQTFQAAAALSATNAIAADVYRSAESQPFLRESILPTTAGTYLAYLDVWERPVGAADDRLLREAALGGPDTAIRDQIVWQLRFARTADLVANGAVAAPVSCASFVPGWSPFGPAAPGKLAARARAAAAVVDPCALPASGGYRSLENHLYRAEIHNGGVNSGTWKWSRDNATHEARYAAIDNGALLVDSLGPDDPTALKRDDWVEILDEARLLAGKPGFFARLSDINGLRVSLGEVRHPDTLVPLTNAGSPDLSVLPQTGGIVRRWEGGLPVAIQPNQWVAIEQGIEVEFAAGRFATGDFWQIPARSLAAAIEWPADPATGAETMLPARGIAHHYAALALVTRAANGTWTVDSDCRNIFPPLTALRSFLYLGGDGQEAMPDPLAPATRVALASPLRVGVIRGKTPLTGLTVEFEITDGDGRLGPVADNLKKRTATTGSDGVATIDWSLDAALPVQRARARLLDAAGNPTHLPIVFTANLSTAAEVSFDPALTPNLAGANTVQKAIEKLAGLQRVGCSTYVVTEGSDWVAILNAIKDGEDASICFQRGLYQTGARVELKNKGHLSIHGAGGGTRIVANRAECALHFEGCASVTLRDLDVSAPDGSGAIEHIDFRQGAVTIVDCPEVEVSGLSLRTGGGAMTERTGLTIRGSEGKPLDSVHVFNNRLAIGLAQDGILITDAVNTIVADNELAVVPGKAGVRPERLFETAVWRKRIGTMLVVDPKAVAAAGGAQRFYRDGEIEVSFESPLPQAEWDPIFAANPPQAAEQRTPSGMQAYIKRVTDLIIAKPQTSATYGRSLHTLGGRLGEARMAGVEDGIKRTLILTTEPSGRVAREPAQTGRNVTIRYRSLAVEFTSPITQADWGKAMKLVPPKEIGDEGALIVYLRMLATRMANDARFRDSLPSAVAWFNRYVGAMPTHARQAITCGGMVLTTVQIRGNKAYGFVRGVHVGTSYRRAKPKPGTVDTTKPLRAGTVSVADNHLSLLKPGQDTYVPMGLFVGNADTVRVQRNLLDWAVPPSNRDGDLYNHGIRVWGDIGKFLLISENRVGPVARVGICVRPQPAISENIVSGYLWLAADNLVEGVSPDRVVHKPGFMRLRDNWPI